MPVDDVSAGQRAVSCLPMSWSTDEFRTLRAHLVRTKVDLEHDQGADSAAPDADERGVAPGLPRDPPFSPGGRSHGQDRSSSCTVMPPRVLGSGTYARISRAQMSATCHAVDLFTDDVVMTGMPGGLVDDGEDGPAEVASLSLECDWRGRIPEPANDSVARLACSAVVASERRQRHGPIDVH